MRQFELAPAEKRSRYNDIFLHLASGGRCATLLPEKQLEEWARSRDRFGRRICILKKDSKERIRLAVQPVASSTKLYTSCPAHNAKLLIESFILEQAPSWPRNLVKPQF